jgi:hypothetical protein
MIFSSAGRMMLLAFMMATMHPKEAEDLRM